MIAARIGLTSTSGPRSCTLVSALVLFVTLAGAATNPVFSQSQAGDIAELNLGSTPVIVGPGVVSTPAEEFKGTVSPDNRTLVYVFTDHLFHGRALVQARRDAHGWSAPEVASFSGIWYDGDPSFAPDGRSLFFISNRPLPGEPANVPHRDYNIWYVTRNGDGSWGNPVALDRNINSGDSEMSPSVARSGTLYFSRGDTILRAEKKAGGYATPTVVKLSAKGAGDPNISADERFMVFDADGVTPGDADLFISCRTATGWAPATRLSEPVSSRAEEGDPSISPDERTLYFFSRRLVSVASPMPHPPLARRAIYADIERDAVNNIYNGSRNLYSVDLSKFSCPATGR